MSGEKMAKKILLHCCCAPCAEYPVADLLNEKLIPSLYYFNPNIHPAFEWERRKEQLDILAAKKSLPIIIDDTYQEQEWRDKTWEGVYASRCIMCYTVRLNAAAKYAADNGFEAFSTSLLVSPYQQHDTIRSLAEEAASRCGISFAYYDWRPHFREGQNMAREDGLYRQKYCGCMYSFEESEWKEKIIRDFPSDFWQKPVNE